MGGNPPNLTAEAMSRWVKRVRRVTPLILSILLLLFLQTGARFFSLATDWRQAVTFLTAIFVASYIYFDWLLREIVARGSDSGCLHLRYDSLSRCLHLAMEGKSKVKCIRIFAISTGQIHPGLLKAFKDPNVKVDKVEILVCDAESSHNRVPPKFAHAISSKIDEWQTLKSNNHIKTLAVWQYDFFPTEYFVIIDSTDLIYGRYFADSTEPSSVEARGASWVTSGSVLGRALIRDAEESFLRLTGKDAEKVGVKPFVAHSCDSAQVNELAAPAERT